MCLSRGSVLIKMMSMGNKNPDKFCLSKRRYGTVGRNLPHNR